MTWNCRLRVWLFTSVAFVLIVFSTIISLNSDLRESVGNIKLSNYLVTATRDGLSVTGTERKQRGSSAQQEGKRAPSVLLLSLPRSGSSLVGDILNHDPSVYFVFEPLHGIDKVLGERLDAVPAENRTAMRKTLMSRFFKKYSIRILDAVFSCRFSDLDLHSLSWEFLGRYPETDGLRRCIDIYTLSQEMLFNASDPDDIFWDTLRPDSLTQCISEAENACRLNAATRLAKVVRVRVCDLDPLFRLHPDLRVILLVRDPRASIRSRIKTFQEEAAKDSAAFVNRLCSDLADDISSAKEMNQTYPGRIRLLRYETLAEDPVRISKILYDYAGLNWTQDVQNKIRLQTLAKNSSINRKELAQKAKKPYALVREDSSKTAMAWRKGVDWSFVQTVQTQCSDLLKELGYNSFKSKDDLHKTSEVPSLSQRKLHIDGITLLQ